MSPVPASRMNLEHLKTFHYVAQSGSFTEAAHRRFLTQPAVSQQIQGLENVLRVALFDRSHKKIALTSEGQVLYAYTQRLFGLFDEIEQVFQDMNQLQSGTLTLAASAVMANYYLPKYLQRFHQRFPQVHYKIRTGNSWQVMNWVANRDVEIGLAGRAGKLPQIQQTLLHREPYVVVAGAATRLPTHRPLTAEEFCRANVVVREKGTRTRAKIEEWLKKQGNAPNAPAPLITVTSLEAAKQLVIAGFGIAALPQLAVADDLACGALRVVAVENFTLSADYYLTCQESGKRSAAAAQFLQILPTPPRKNGKHP